MSVLGNKPERQLLAYPQCLFQSCRNYFATRLTLFPLYDSSPTLDFPPTSIGFDGSINPVHKFRNPRIDAGLHGVGAAQTPRRDTLQDELVVGVTH